jgi:hypothetical protein
MGGTVEVAWPGKPDGRFVGETGCSRFDQKPSDLDVILED